MMVFILLVLQHLEICSSEIVTRSLKFLEKYFIFDCAFYFWFFFFFYFWLYFWLCTGLSLVVAVEHYSLLPCEGFSLKWLLLSPSTGSRCSDFSGCGFRALEHRLIRCGAWAWFLCGTWDLPGPGIKPVSPVLAGRFLSTVPPGKSKSSKFFVPKVELLGLFSPLWNPFCLCFITSWGLRITL